ncbi:MAG: HD domain-containing phosphohydrolase [Pseudomonadota bacterium]
MKQSRVHVSELKLGMYVRELDCPWEKSSFLFQGFTLETPNDIAAVQDECEYVVVDFLTHEPQNQKKSGDTAMLNSSPILDVDPSLGFAKDFEQAGDVHQKAESAVGELFGDMKLANTVDGDAVKGVVEDCVSSILKNPDAILWYTQIQNKDDALSRHSLNVTILSIALGRHLKLREYELNDLGTCALLHDVGKTHVPLEVLRKDSQLTDRESQIMKSHTLEGRNILLSSKSVFSGAADVAFSHHEHVDGSGYPRRVNAKSIPYYSKIVALANRYDNLVKTESFGQTCSTTEALQTIFNEKGTKFDEALTTGFIECLGVYPPGTLIEMNNGEVGIVLSNASENKLQPRVILVLDENKDPQPQRVVDLSRWITNSAGEPYSIKATLRNKTYDVDIEDYIRAGLRIEGMSAANSAD